MRTAGIIAFCLAIFTAGDGAAPDSLTINWNPTDATVSCTAAGVLLTSISVQGHRADRTRFSVNLGEYEIPANANTKTVQLGTSNSPVAAYKIVVAVNRLFQSGIKAIKKTDF